ncbi:MAG: hypothetical protein ACO28M_09825 [Vulcanococcus sp.]
MFRLRGDRQSLLNALAIHWVDQQLGIPTTEGQAAAPPSTTRLPKPGWRHGDRLP